MPLSNAQINYRLMRGQKLSMAMVLRGDQVLKTLYEPIGAVQFEWKEKGGLHRRYTCYGGPTFIWQSRDVYVYDYTDPIPYKLKEPVKRIPLDSKDLTKDIEINTKEITEENIPTILRGLSSDEFDDVVASNFIGSMLSELRGKEKKGPGISIVMIVIIIMVFIAAAMFFMQ